MCAGAVSRSDACASGTHLRRAPAARAVARPGGESSGSGSSSARSRPAYGLRGATVGATATRVRAQPPEHAPVVADRISALRRLDNLNHRREPRSRMMCRNGSGPIVPSRSTGAVEMRPGRALGVIEMQALEMREPDLPVELLPYLLQRLATSYPAACRCAVSRQNPLESGPYRGALAQRPQLLERAPERGARARVPSISRLTSGTAARHSRRRVSCVPGRRPDRRCSCRDATRPTGSRGRQRSSSPVNARMLLARNASSGVARLIK